MHATDPFKSAECFLTCMQASPLSQRVLGLCEDLSWLPY
jgi:hypothetical protein